MKPPCRGSCSLSAASAAAETLPGSKLQWERRFRLSRRKRCQSIASSQRAAWPRGAPPLLRYVPRSIVPPSLGGRGRIISQQGSGVKACEQRNELQTSSTGSSMEAPESHPKAPLRAPFCFRSRCRGQEQFSSSSLALALLQPRTRCPSPPCLARTGSQAERSHLPGRCRLVSLTPDPMGLVEPEEPLSRQEPEGSGSSQPRGDGNLWEV